jgi:hypothetical protein
LERKQSSSKKKYSAQKEYGVMNEERDGEVHRVREQKACGVKRSRKRKERRRRTKARRIVGELCFVEENGRHRFQAARRHTGPGPGWMFPLFSRWMGRNCGAFQPGKSAPPIERGMFLGDVHAVQY